MVEIVFAKLSDREDILAFLNDHWQRGHVFTKDKALFDWQHRLPGSEELSFVLGRQTSGGEILGLLGYVPVAQYDPQSPTGDFTLATWKVRDDCEVNGLGIFLFKALTKRLKPDFVGVVGLSDMVVPIYKALRFETGKMAHHVFFNRRKETFGLAMGVTSDALPSFEGKGQMFETAADLSTLQGALGSQVSAAMAQTIPQRRREYLRGRYGNHPYYRYQLSVANHDACFVWRKIELEQGACLRMVDYFGDAAGLGGWGSAFQALLETEAADYIDIVHMGLGEEALRSAGFVDRLETENLIVAHHFEPFTLRNSDLAYAWRVFDKQNERSPILLRGFTDQDRPNVERAGRGMAHE